MYSFLATVRFLELALKNMFVPIHDSKETLPRFYAQNNVILLIRYTRIYVILCNSIISETAYFAHSSYCGPEQKFSGHCISNESWFL